MVLATTTSHIDLGGGPRSSVPYPFNTRQYARLLVFRSRLQDQLAGEVQPDGTGSLIAPA